MPATDSLFATIWRSPVLRACFLSSIFTGIGASCTIPFITLFLVDELGVSLSRASAFYLTGVITPVAGSLLGKLSDQQRDRLLLVRVCSLLQCAGWLVIAGSGDFWIPLVVNAAVLSLGVAAVPLNAAAVRDEILHRGLPRQTQLMTAVRLSYVAAWGVGPVAGSWIADQAGVRSLFVFAAASFALTLLPLHRIAVPRFVTVATAHLPGGSLKAIAPLLIFCALATLAQSGTSLKFSYMAVFAEDDLLISGALLGLIIGIQPVAEVPLMVLAGHFADRFGATIVILTGLVFGGVSFLAYATADGALGLFAGQLLGAVMHATVIGVGISIAQGLYPRGVGVASSFFYGSLALAGTVAGIVAAIAVDPLGLPHVFYIPAMLCVVAFAGMLVMSKSIAQAERAFDQPHTH